MSKNFAVSGFAGALLAFFWDCLFTASFFKELYARRKHEYSLHLLGCMTFGFLSLTLYAWAESQTVRPDYRRVIGIFTS
jgi:hypothetical protein